MALMVVDCKGEKNVAQLLRDTMQSYIKRNFPDTPKIRHTAINVGKDNVVIFPEELAYLKAFEESKKRISVKFTLKAA